ncbi:MAG: hypothetical protein QXO71_08910 [Candidatus Jordarchaeaceae archaeon]
MFDSVSRDMIGREVTMYGLVVNCKAGPCLKVKNDIIYIQELEDMAFKIMGRRVSVTGVLLEEKIIPDPEIRENGTISTGAYGNQLVLKNIKEVRIHND